MADWERRLKPVRYFNCNGFAVSVVAAINYHDGELYDWAVYIAGTDQTWKEEDAHKWAAEMGDKMTRADAHHFCPVLPIDKWRP